MQSRKRGHTRGPGLLLRTLLGEVIRPASWSQEASARSLRLTYAEAAAKCEGVGASLAVADSHAALAAIAVRKRLALCGSSVDGEGRLKRHIAGKVAKKDNYAFFFVGGGQARVFETNATKVLDKVS